MLRTVIALALIALPLAACGDDKEGTTIAINTTGSDGNMVAGMNGKTGEVAIDVPGFSGKLTLPKLHINAENFDMNGVHLYPGSTISGMNINAHDGPGKKDDDGSVRVIFESPAAPGAVRDWFRKRLSDADFKLQDSGAGLSGKTDEDKPFSLELSPSGDGRSKGVISIDG